MLTQTARYYLDLTSIISINIIVSFCHFCHCILFSLLVNTQFIYNITSSVSCTDCENQTLMYVLSIGGTHFQHLLHLCQVYIKEYHSATANNWIENDDLKEIRVEAMQTTTAFSFYHQHHHLRRKMERSSNIYTLNTLPLCPMSRQI